MAMMNPKRNSVTRILTPIALALTIAACSSQPSAPTSVDITAKPSDSAQTYLMRADSNQGGFANEWLIMAFKASLAEGNLEQAEKLSARLAKQNLTVIQQAEWQLTRAELNLAMGKPQDVYSQLNFAPEWPLSPQQWAQYHQLRASSLSETEQYFEASRELTYMAAFVPQSEQAVIADQVWQNLEQYSAEQITEFSTQPSEEVLDGWLQLAIYTKTMGSSLTQLQSTLQNWLAENSNHPAALYTPIAIQDILALEITRPRSTALLLPVTGKFAKQAQLVRDGFMLAMMDDQERDPQAIFTVIDTNDTTAEQVKQKLVENSVDFIVGPLTKNNVEALQQAQSTSESPIPALALNIPNTLEATQNLCYLTLSPEQEVAQAAKHLHEQGYQYPLVLAPASALGRRVVKAFEDEWQTLSNNKVAVNQFANRSQLQLAINSVFGLQESQQRIAQMEGMMEIKLESQPRSRRDIDSVYIVANNAELTLIKPFVEVAINPDARQPKLFADSRSHSSKRQYEDLTGVAYSDIPMLINEDQALEAQLDKFWPKSSNGEKRLQALGMDAYMLTNELPQMKVVTGYTVEGQTGQLSIDENCVVQRKISWAEHGTAITSNSESNDQSNADESSQEPSAVAE
jgi:outer membrane PBP1 activator LpoA protein